MGGDYHLRQSTSEISWTSNSPSDCALTYHRSTFHVRNVSNSLHSSVSHRSGQCLDRTLSVYIATQTRYLISPWQSLDVPPSSTEYHVQILKPEYRSRGLGSDCPSVVYGARSCGSSWIQHVRFAWSIYFYVDHEATSCSTSIGVNGSGCPPGSSLFRLTSRFILLLLQ